MTAKSYCKKLWSTEGVTVKRTIACFFSEFLATYSLVFFGCMGCVDGIGGNPHNLLEIALCFGFAVLVSVQCFAHISGSHLNPVVTISHVMGGYMPMILVPVYIVAQLIGAIAAFGCLILVTPSKLIVGISSSERSGICSPRVHKDLNLVQAFFVEFITTSFLILVCCAVWDWRNKMNMDSVSIRFGLTIAGLAMAGGHYTGANMNPARSLAPVIFNGDWDNHWVYWLGPIAASVLTTLFYIYVFSVEEEKKESNTEK